MALAHDISPVIERLVAAYGRREVCVLNPAFWGRLGSQDPHLLEDPKRSLLPFVRGWEPAMSLRRPMIMRLLWFLMVLLLAVGCGADREEPLAAEEPQGTSSTIESRTPDDRNDSIALSVTLWHCGVEQVTADGRLWEVPRAESVDGFPDLPLDATNTPSDWVGSGIAVVQGDEMIYTDEGGEVVEFAPDDGQPPGPCE